MVSCWGNTYFKWISPMTNTRAISRKLIRDIEDMVEDAFPNLLHEQDFIFTRLHSNIQARLLHENHYKRMNLLRKEAERKITPIRKSGTNEIK